MWQDLAPLLPRISELALAASNESSDDNYFNGLEDDMQRDAQVLEHYVALERTLEPLDGNAWVHLKDKCLRYSFKRSRRRGWAQLITTLNEAKGYCLLRQLECSNISFVGESNVPTPDVRGWQRDLLIHVEVKTVQKSDTVISNQQELGRAPLVFRSIPSNYDDRFREKLRLTLVEAEAQLGAADRRIALLVIHPDLWTQTHADNLLASLQVVRPPVVEVVYEVRGLQACLTPRVAASG